MALLTPAPFTSLRQQAGHYRELDVVERLHLALGEDYEIFHSLTWHAIGNGAEHRGELDVVVLAPTGNILIVEVKSGELRSRNGVLLKCYGSEEHDVARQCRLQFGAVVRGLEHAGLHAFVSNCLVLPDYRLIDGPATLSMPRERIIDAASYDRLGTLAVQMMKRGSSKSPVEHIRQFLRNEYKVGVDLAATSRQLRRAVTRLSDGLATWVPRITSPSGCFRVQATAGSGKTQLALRLMEDAVVREQAVLYVCFNRTLSDHVKSIAPVGAMVANLHELCIGHYRRLHGEPDFSDKTIFAQAAAQYVEACGDLTPRYDILIIDEGQDFEPDWIEVLRRQTKIGGQLYLLQDDDQRLYPRAPCELAGAVDINCPDNFRSPGAVCDVINAFSLASRTIISRNPYRGELPQFYVCATTDGVGLDDAMLTCTARAVDALLQRGFAIDDIVVLTGRGHGKSTVQRAGRIGSHLPRHFTGEYSAAGEQLWSEGELKVESIFRFKGQSAPAIVLTEIDFSMLDDAARRILFVGLTRACMAVDVVMSQAAEQCLGATLGV
jgi:hypothetical protein